MPEVPDFDGFFDLYWSGPERRISGLTLRIIGVNAAALLMLAVGVIYLGQYQKSLIEARLETFRTEVTLVASALSDRMDGTPGSARDRVVKRLSQAMNESIYVFDETGRMVANSDKITAQAEMTGIFEMEPRKKTYHSVLILKKMADFVLQFVPDRQVLPPYPAPDSQNAADYPDASDAMKGLISMSAWEDKGNPIFLTTAAPVYTNGKITGAVMLTRQGNDIEEDINAVWVNILKIFSSTLVITILLSIYLSGTIAAPLRRLAQAAEDLRRGKPRGVEIPDFSERNDEIGELSIVMREMTQALWDRMDMTERFAADVAHELKNPLTSLKSAMETLHVVKADKDRKKLLEIIAHDIERMDRLISDISNASRLDAELSRAILQRIDIRAVLRNLIEFSGRGRDAKIILNDTSEEESFAWGLEGRLEQVFENLISNALSFSPQGGKIHLTIVPGRKRIIVTVEDEGPGIPENRLETIFERFYTERPQHEGYGEHSGLGLSICKQIVSALGGQIFAENIRDAQQNIKGARFTVILGRA